MKLQRIVVVSFLLFVNLEVSSRSLEEGTGIAQQEPEGEDQLNDYIEDEKDLDYMRPDVDAVDNKFDETAPKEELPKTAEVEQAPEEEQEESASGGGLQLPEDSKEQDPSIFVEELSA